MIRNNNLYIPTQNPKKKEEKVRLSTQTEENKPEIRVFQYSFFERNTVFWKTGFTTPCHQYDNQDLEAFNLFRIEEANVHLVEFDHGLQKKKQSFLHFLATKSAWPIFSIMKRINLHAFLKKL